MYFAGGLGGDNSRLSCFMAYLRVCILVAVAAVEERTLRDNVEQDARLADKEAIDVDAVVKEKETKILELYSGT